MEQVRTIAQRLKRPLKDTELRRLYRSGRGSLKAA
jgi:homocitrate synthase NifV